MNKLSSDEIDLVLYSKTGIGSGEFSNNPWLQELPDPISKTTWDKLNSVNLRGPFLLTKVVARKMQKNTSIKQLGQIQNTSQHM